MEDNSIHYSFSRFRNNLIYSYSYFNIYNLIGILLVILCGLILYTKIRFPFWSGEPVFHIYDIHHWIRPKGIISEQAFKERNYYKLRDEQYLFSNINKLPEKSLKETLDLLGSNFLHDEDMEYVPTKSAFLSYFNQHKYTPFISNLYNNNSLIGTITSRPMHIKIDNETPFICNYVDFLCVHKNNRKQNNAAKLIYNLSRSVQNYTKGKLSTFFFKREGLFNPIVPITRYYSYCYDCEDFKGVTWNNVYPTIKMVAINEDNYELLWRNFPKMLKVFELYCHPDSDNLKMLIKAQVIIPVVIHEKDSEDIMACFFFRNPQTFYNGERMFELCCTYISQEPLKHKYAKEVITNIFGSIIVYLKEVYKTRYLLVETTSHIQQIWNVMKKKNILFECPMSYYFYNIAQTPKESAKCFILN